MAETERNINGKKNMLTEFDLMYMGRGYARLQTYKSALVKLRLIGKEHVLDAGCGYGAWTYALSKLNTYVIGIEKDEDKSKIAMGIVENNTRNADIFTCGIEEMNEKPYGNEQFDGILCYHTIYYTKDWHKTLESLASLMTPGGVMYINIATKACFMYMAQRDNTITAKMGIDALNNDRKRSKGEDYSTESGLPIDQKEFETELTRLHLDIKWTGTDEIACHPGVIGYVVERMHNDM
jgi:SAM-dependent methyltransferase